MLYTIGNKPIFPSSFNYKEYYYYLEFEENNKVYIVVRRGDSYIVSCAGDIRFLKILLNLRISGTTMCFRCLKYL